MITTPEEYYALYHRIQSENPPSLAILLPSDEKIYEVNLNTRKIEAPATLSVETDHLAEIIYFKMARFYDHMDLSNTVGVIEYINAKGESKAYVIPYYDIHTLAEDEMILFPWFVSSEVTKKAGQIQFSMSFYIVSSTNTKYEFNLNTLPAISKVVGGIGKHLELNLEEEPTAGIIEQILTDLKKLKSEYDIYWEED